jgi:hypothetical protein
MMPFSTGVTCWSDASTQLLLISRLIEVPNGRQTVICSTSLMHTQTPTEYAFTWEPAYAIFIYPVKRFAIQIQLLSLCYVVRLFLPKSNVLFDNKIDALKMHTWLSLGHLVINIFTFTYQPKILAIGLLDPQKSTWVVL